MKPIVREAHTLPWGTVEQFQPATVEFIGPWPDGGTGMCVRSFPADSIAESTRQARTFALALEVGRGNPPIDRGDSWEIAA